MIRCILLYPFRTLQSNEYEINNFTIIHYLNLYNGFKFYILTKIDSNLSKKKDAGEKYNKPHDFLSETPSKMSMYVAHRISNRLDNISIVLNNLLIFSSLMSNFGCIDTIDVDLHNIYIK